MSVGCVLLVVLVAVEEVLGVLLATVSVEDLSVDDFCVSAVLLCVAVLAVSVAATEALELVVSWDCDVLAVEELGEVEAEELVLELGGVEDWFAYVLLEPWAVLDDAVGLCELVLSVVLAVELGVLAVSLVLAVEVELGELDVSVVLVLEVELGELVFVLALRSAEELLLVWLLLSELLSVLP